jgi:hypothetical protein
MSQWGNEFKQYPYSIFAVFRLREGNKPNSIRRRLLNALYFGGRRISHCNEEKMLTRYCLRANFHTV